MNYLTALLAFSAVMIVLATIATVVVEGMHKIARKRAGDFEQMLSRLYEDAVKPRLEDANINVNSNGQDFAREITRNPVFVETTSGFLTKIPVLKNLFNTEFEELTTRQFIEQFAQTKAGKKLQEKQTDLIQSTVSDLAYEFERYGEAASNYFQRRATTLSVLVAFVIALSLNVDAISLYSTLATDKTLAEKVITDLDITELEKAYLESIKNADDKAGEEKIKKMMEDTRKRIREDSERLQGLGLPVGHDYFPYCAELDDTDTGPVKDARCRKLKTEPLPKNSRSVLSRLITQDGIAWLFSALLAGGLIGLGAPFWFKTYRFIASFVPGLKLPDSTLARQSKRQLVVSQTTSTSSAAPAQIASAAAPPTAGAPPAAPARTASAAAPPAAGAPPAAPPEPQVGLEVGGLSDTDLLDAFVKSAGPPPRGRR